MRLVVSSCLLASALLSNTAFAEQIQKPYTFSSGSQAMASQVNANFDTLYPHC
jgi:hypothetical protein